MRLPGEPEPEVRRRLARACECLPLLEGRPIRLCFRPELRAWRGRLVSGSRRGEEVHAGSQLRKRLIVLDRALLDRPGELKRILTHELFHFVWLRIPHSVRLSYEELLRRELAARARGELGWSAELRKARLEGGDAAGRSRRWRDYACESFCDTGAWLYSGLRAHEEFTLKPRFREGRRRWWAASIGARETVPV